MGTIYFIFFVSSTPPDSVEPFYYDYKFREIIIEAPWVVAIDDTINFLFYMHDCDYDPLEELHCIAIYNLTNEIHYYYWNYRPQCAPSPNIEGDTIGEPPISGDPTNPICVPNQIFYHHYADHPTITTNHWLEIINRFQHVGNCYSPSLNGDVITPRKLLGNYVGDTTLTFRAVLIGDEPEHNEVYYKDLRIRVVNASQTLPKIQNWYHGDMHVHSSHSQGRGSYLFGEYSEMGLPIEYMTIAAKNIGLDFVTFTDHSFTITINPGRWDTLHDEVQTYSIPNKLVLIRGEETTARWGHYNTEWWTWCHILTYRTNSLITSHEFATPISLYRTWEVLSGGEPPNYGNYPSNNIRAQDGFAYLAHPASHQTENEEINIKIDCLRHRVFRGYQIFNERKTHWSDYVEPLYGTLPWGLDYPWEGNWQHSDLSWFDSYGNEVKLWDKRMSYCLSPHGDTTLGGEFRKIFIIGGSDTHGGCNYNCGASDAHDCALGNFRTAVYCPGGLTRDNILNGLKNGRSVVTDGPMMIFGLDMNNDGDIYDAGDLLIGDGDNNEDGSIDYKARLFGACADSGSGGAFNQTSYLNFLFQWQSNSFFGPIDSIVLYQGKPTTGDNPIKVCKLVPSNGQQGTVNYLYYWPHWVVDSINSYFRAVAYSHYGSGTGAGQIYRCFTNPIWVKGYFETPPINLHIVYYNECSVKIAWEWIRGWIPDAWKILRREFDSPWPYVWDTVGTANGYGVREYIDNTVERGKKYVYRVVAAKGTTRSKHSNSAVVQVPLLNAPHHELRVHSPASDRIVVQFQDKSNYETNFEVWRRCPPTGEPWHIETTLPAQPSSGNWVTWIDYNVKPESTYLYRVRAYTSTPPAGYSAYTGVYGATVAPHLKTSRDSATAYQPKVLYDPDNHRYHMAYGLESLLVASRSTDGLNWEGPITACYWGQEMYERDAGFCQLDLKDDGLPVMVFSYRNRKTFPPNPLWWSSIHFAYFNPDSSDWLDSVCIFRGEFYQNEAPPFHPFTAQIVMDTVHVIFILGSHIYYTQLRCNFETGKYDATTPILFDTSFAYGYPAMDKDESGNLYVAWRSDYTKIHYRERINGNWSDVEEAPGLEIGNWISHLSLKRINNKTYLLVTEAMFDDAPDYCLTLRVKDSGGWQPEPEHIIGDESMPCGAGQIISEGVILYHRCVNNNWDIYYSERLASGWSDPICVKNTPAKSKFPQGCFDGENICLIWTEGDAAPYTIDTAKIRVIPQLEIVYPTTEEILGARLRVGLPLLIKWVSSDNVGVVKHRVYYSLDNGTTYNQIGGDLSGTTYELNWTVPDTLVSGLKIKIEAYDGVGMSCAKEVGPFTTTKELVFNSNFEEVSEDKPYLWTPYGTGDLFEADWQEVQNGQFSAHIKRSASASYFGFYQEKIPVEPNKLYWLQGYIKTEATAGYANLAFGVWHQHPDTNHHRDFGNVSGNTDWTYVCDSLTTRPYEDTIRVMMFGNPAFVGETWFDNLNLLIDTIPPQVIVSYPNGGESLLVEQKINICWYAADNVKIGRIDSVLYSTNAGQTWNVIALNLPASAVSCEWTVPAWCQEYKIRVVASDASGNRSRDESDGVFGTKYFTYSGFEYTDPAGLDNILVDAQGVKDCEGRVVSGYMNGVGPHSGNFMFKISGMDTSATQNSFVIFKVFPYDFVVHDSTYFSFWLYIEDAPTDSGHICMDAYTKDGEILRNWNRFGYVLDQTGQKIHPGIHSAPKGEWCQYVFSFNPAVKETIDYLVLIYDDHQNTETGYFEGYIDDIEVLDSFPIPNTWHCEKFPTDPTYGDPNFNMNFFAQGDSVRLIIDPQGDGGIDGHWIGPVPGLRNDIIDIPIGVPVNGGVYVYWEQYDKDHSLILGLLIHDNQGQDRWLYYAKNASNWWQNTGWVDMGDPTPHYNTWEWCYRNIRSDYIAEYNAIPEVIKELRLEHFARSEWVGDHGGTIKRLFIGEDTEPPIVQVIQPNGGEKLEIGSVYPIIWNAIDTTKVGLQTIYYSTNSGAEWHNVTGIDTIFEPIASYQYDWTVPGHPSDNCLIKVVSKDIANNTGSDISNGIFSICYLTSSDSSATAGNGEKIVYDNGVLHFVFTSEDSIFYSYSVDQGNTWHKKQLIDFGQYPAIAVDELHRVHLVYKKGNGYWYKELTGWGVPVCIYTQTTRALQSPSFVVKGDYGYLAFEEREYAGMDPVSHLMFGVYHIGAPPNGNFEVEEIIYDVSEFLKNPHLAMVWDSIPQIVYEKGNSVYYIQGLSGGIKGYKGKSRGGKSEIRNSKSETNFNSQIPNSPSPLSSPIKGEGILVDEILKQDEMLKQVQHDIVQNDTLTFSHQGRRDWKDGPSFKERKGFGMLNWTEPIVLGNGNSPKISVDGEIIDVVWENSGEIFHRRKWFYAEFDTTENISNSLNRISKNPIVFSPYLIVWLEEPQWPDSRFDLVYGLWKYNRWYKGIITPAAENCYAPKAFFDGTKLHTIFTYGNQARYGIKYASAEIVLPQMTSDTKLATASNNVKRLVLDNSNHLHIFYRSGNYIFYNTQICTGSGTDGSGFSPSPLPSPTRGEGSFGIEILKQPVNQVQGMVQNDKKNRDGALYIGKENVFEHNFLYHIYNNTPDTIDARHNYWYPSEPESIEYYICDYHDDPNLGPVIFEPTVGTIAGGLQGNEMSNQVRQDITINYGSNPARVILIKYGIIRELKLEISVYDASGCLIARDDCIRKPGEYNFMLGNLACGVYFIKFNCEGIEIKRKIILLP